MAAPESHLVSGGSDNRLIVWECRNGKVSHLIPGTLFVRCVLSSDWGPPAVSSLSRWRSVKATLVQFVPWTPSTWRTPRSWWPPQHRTPRSDCGSATKPLEVMNTKATTGTNLLVAPCGCCGATLCCHDNVANGAKE